eukprot:UC1_evm1s2074
MSAIRQNFEEFAGRNVVLLAHCDVPNGASQRMPPGVVVALINGDMVLDPYQVFMAVYSALAAERRGKLITKSLSSEVVFALSPSRQTRKAFDTFGAGGGDGALGGSSSSSAAIVAAIFDPSESDIEAVSAALDGTPLPQERVARMGDPARIAAAYRVEEAELAISSLLDCVLHRMAVKSVLRK